MPQSQAHPEAVALYRAILAHPDEDTPPVVFIRTGDSPQ
jgi:hypothetical protein